MFPDGETPLCCSCFLAVAPALAVFLAAALEAKALDREVVEDDLMETSLESEELRLLRALRIESLSESVF